MPNLFADWPGELSTEVVDILAQGDNLRIERILSYGQSSPKGFWYDQELSEWVAVLKGEAKLLMEEGNSLIHLKAGDCLTIPAHQRHRVEWTTPAEPTLWLAVFFQAP